MLYLLQQMYIDLNLIEKFNIEVIFFLFKKIHSELYSAYTL